MRVALMMALACGGCVGGGDGGSLSPIQKCERLMDLICSRVEECGELTMGPAPAGFHDDCVAVAECDRTISVDSGYDACLQELDTVACGDFFPAGGDIVPPDSCDAVLNRE